MSKMVIEKSLLLPFINLILSACEGVFVGAGFLEEYPSQVALLELGKRIRTLALQ